MPAPAHNASDTVRVLGVPTASTAAAVASAGPCFRRVEPPRELQVGNYQRFLESGSPGGQAPGGIVDDAAAVEDQLVLPAHRVHVGDGKAVVRGTLGDHLFPEGPFAGVEWRGVDVDDQLGPGLALHRGWPHRVPDVLADVDADQYPADPVDRADRALFEVTLFIEDAVIGQEDLLIGVQQPAVVANGGGVVDLGAHIAGSAVPVWLSIQ